MTHFASDKVSKEWLHALFMEACEKDPAIVDAAVEDLRAHLVRDPAACSWLNPFLYFKGYHSLQVYRFAHYAFRQGRKSVAYYLQSRVAQEYDVDIHPAARLGRGIDQPALR